MFTTLLSFSGLQIKIQQFVLFYLLTESVLRKIDVIRKNIQSNGLLSCIPQPISMHYTNIKTRLDVFYSGRLYIHEKREGSPVIASLLACRNVQNRRRRALVASLYIRHKERARINTLETNGKWLISNIYR